MSTIKIIFKGLALCYHKTDADGKDRWRVIFPFDDKKHRIKFSCKLSDGTVCKSGELAKAKRTIQIVTNQEVVVPQTPNHSSFGSFVNISRYHRRVKIKGNWKDLGVVMYLDNAYFSSAQNTDRDFFLTLRQLPYPYEPFGLRLGRIGEVVGAEIKLNEGGNAKLIVDKKDFELFPYVEGVDYILEFDNDCNDSKENRTCDGHSDFPQYYQIIEDAVNNGLQFDLRGEPDEKDRDYFRKYWGNFGQPLKEEIFDMGNPLILCGGVRIEDTSTLP
jgi:hypothetical protein